MPEGWQAKAELVTLEEALADPNATRRLALAFIKKPAKIADAAEQLRLQTVWRSKVEVLFALQSDPSKINDAKTFVTSAKSSPQKGHAKDKPFWDDSNRPLDRLPRYFLGEVIVAASARGSQEGRFTPEDLARVDAKDPMGARLMFEYFTAMDSSIKIPKVALRKVVTHEAALARIQQVGDRWIGFKKCIASSASSGVIDWSKAAYSVAKVESKIQIRLCQCGHWAASLEKQCSRQPCVF